MAGQTEGWRRGEIGPHIHMILTPEVAISRATLRVPVFVAPLDLEITEVLLWSSTLFSGEDTTTIHLNLIDGGQAGAGTAQIANIDLVSGTDLAIGSNVLLATATADHFLSQGDMLEFEIEEISTGHSAILPPLLMTVAWRVANLAA